MMLNILCADYSRRLQSKQHRKTNRSKLFMIITKQDVNGCNNSKNTVNIIIHCNSLFPSLPPLIFKASNNQQSSAGSVCFTVNFLHGVKGKFSAHIMFLHVS